jgi:hypothetical protein
MPPGTPQPRAVQEPAPPPVAPPEAAPQPHPTAVAEAPIGGLELATVTELWPAVVDAIRVDDDVLAMCLTEATPVDCAERSLVIAFHPDDTMRRRKADSARARQVVAEAELLERLKAEFDAEEILDDPDDPEGAA